jgi:hypothetical protein
MNRVTCALAGASFLIAVGCGGEGVEPAPSAPPTMPVTNPGTATVRGKVVNADRQAIAGAILRVLDMPAGETPRTTTSAADGSWELTIPGNTSVSIRAEATDFAPTLGNTLSVVKGQTSAELELMLVPVAQIDQLSAMMGGARVAEYGAAAIEVLSVGGACDPAGGKVIVEPTELGRVLYSKPNSATPDTTLTATQTRARPAAWLLGVLPPGNYYRVRFEKAGCAQKAWPVEYKGRTYDGKLPIATKVLSHGLLFVD